MVKTKKDFGDIVVDALKRGTTAMDKKKFTCVLCKGKFRGWGNNPYPLKDNGRACDDCNVDVVLARINRLGKSIPRDVLAKVMGK